MNVKLNILGSGGALSLPRPLCFCPNCSQARAKGIPYERTGPSMYVYGGGGILFDTPEEIRLQIERERIEELSHIFFTHWHPDHTQGLRIVEHLKHVYRGQNNNPPNPAKIYIPANDVDAFREHCGGLWFMEKQGYALIIAIEDRQPIEIGEFTITPLDFKRIDRVRYGYLVSEGGKKVLYAPCSVFGIQTDEFYENLDCLVIELGWLGDTAKTRADLPAKHTWHDHISFEEDITLVRQLRPRRTILTHVDGSRHLDDHWGHDSLCQLAKSIPDACVQIAFDGMRLNF